MRQLSYRLTFHTPAFLGNAEQAAQWRTPPIKALLRQWWRVVYAGDHRQGLRIEAMREAEGRLFGHAWLESDRDEEGRKVAARRSEVRLRLDGWRAGSLRSWDGLEQRPVDHQEVQRTGGKVGPHVYLGFGPLTVEGRATVLTKGRAAIQANDASELRLALPDGDEGERVCRALLLIDRFGALGGRSRNGWGSLGLSALPGTPTLGGTLDSRFTLPYLQALKEQWPQAIATGPYEEKETPLIWQTVESFVDWKLVMRRLAEIKIAMRRRFVFTTGRDAPQPEARHWLSYPVTNHSVKSWGGNARLPNTLRFKVRPDPDGRLRGVVFHMPCLPPPAFRPEPKVIERVWQQVHAHLDADRNLQRIPS